jgi:hypothetical protein
MFLPIFCSPPCSKCMKRTFAQVVEKMKSTLETTRKIMYILVLCEFVRKYSNWTLKMVLARDRSLVDESHLVLHRLLVSAPGQDKSGPRPSLAAAKVEQYIETETSEITELTKDQEYVEDQEGIEDLKNKDE